MIALFESGSTRLHFTWWNGKEIGETANIFYPDSPDSLRKIVTDFLGENTPDKIAACSVSSKWRELLFRIIDDTFPGRLVVARTASDVGIEVSYDKPETYGIDRALAAYGAFQIYKNSCVVVDAGTAITIDAVTHNGTIAGGYIFPGSDILAASLSSKTGLPLVSICDVAEGIGNSTITSISFGITLGFSAAVGHLIKNAMKIAESDNRVVITGGGAEDLIKCLAFPVDHKPHLVLESLGLIAGILPEYS